MANLYGVANPVANFQYYTLIGAASVACPAGVETNVFQTGTLTALDRGIYYAVAWVQIAIQFGAVTPTTVGFGLRFNNGADQGAYGINYTTFVANAYINYPWAFASAPSATAFAPPGTNIQISVNPATQPVTAYYGFSWAVIGILRAPDQ